MGVVTGIAWTDHTWSPWWGCTQVSPACDNCYAMALDKRVGGAHWGAGVPRKAMSEAHWKAPLAWNRKAAAAGKARFVFPSMCDPFDNEVPMVWRDRFWELMIATPNLTWLLLTKRIGNVRRMTWDAGLHWPRNAWLGATIVTQAEADRDVPKLLDTDGPAIRFLSIEPMLEEIDLGGSWLKAPVRLDWIIAGGESGSRPRPIRTDWVAALRDQCAHAGVPFFFKQWGGRTPKANGKMLDGREWCERPELAA